MTDRSEAVAALPMHRFGAITHEQFGHDWPLGQCGPCLDFGDRLGAILADAGSAARVAAALRPEREEAGLRALVETWAKWDPSPAGTVSAQGAAEQTRDTIVSSLRAALVAPVAGSFAVHVDEDGGADPPIVVGVAPVAGLDSALLTEAMVAVLGDGEVSTIDGSMGTDRATARVVAEYARLAADRTRMRVIEGYDVVWEDAEGNPVTPDALATPVETDRSEAVAACLTCGAAIFDPTAGCCGECGAEDRWIGSQWLAPSFPEDVLPFDLAARLSPYDLIRQGINRNRHTAVNAVREPGAAGWNRGLDRALAVVDQIEKEARDSPGAGDER